MFFSFHGLFHGYKRSQNYRQQKLTGKHRRTFGLFKQNDETCFCFARRYVRLPAGIEYACADVFPHLG